MKALEAIAGLIAPAECLVCGMEGDIVCDACLHLLPVVKRGTCFRCNRISPLGRTCALCRRHTKLAGVSVASHYEGHVKELILALKYKYRRDAAKPLATLLASLFDPNDFDIITAVPAAPARRRERGFDHAALMAQHLADVTKLPYSSLLTRYGTARQVGTNRRQRLQQVKGSFELLRLLPFDGARVLLIDDVATTGATLSACALVLRTAGVKRVWGAVAAKH
jgi:ComF family protein